MWVLGTELRSSGKAVSILNYQAVFPAPWIITDLNKTMSQFVPFLCGNYQNHFVIFVMYEIETGSIHIEVTHMYMHDSLW